tara:strand:+ start:566 stop:1453 length:888 start_codon:yes stop_codon:yes gene_type:complete
VEIFNANFPVLDNKLLRSIQRGIDDSYLEFSRTFGAKIESFFDPLLYVLIWFEQGLMLMPWWSVICLIGIIAYLSSRSLIFTFCVCSAFLSIGFLGMWDNTMRTVAIILLSTFFAVLIGVPIGLLMSRSNILERLVLPVLDIMQTMPIFVYLIPVVMLFGLGKVPGLIAVVIYAIPPVIRLTNLGIRLVDKDILEAAEAFGTSKATRMLNIEIPLALPNILAGINQTIMMALSMVVIASMIGVKGLGQPVLQAVTNQYFAVGLFNGMAVVCLAIVFDRITQNFGRRIQKEHKPII